MKRIIVIVIALLSSSSLHAADKPRLIVLTDIGGDPDDQQSMIRLMTYANEFDIEGLIATAAGVPGELKQDVVRPQLIREIVEAFGKVRENLLQHAPGYPTRDYLLERIKTGNPKRGMTSIGDGKDTEGSDWIIRVVDQKDARPVNIAIWGGSTELAQALMHVKNKRTAAELKAFLAKIRVYDISHQDDTGPWIVENFPDVFYVLSKAPDGKDKRDGGYRGMYLGGDESLTSAKWVDDHVRLNHGPLGALYPTKTWTAPNPHSTLKEGDTPSWFYFLPTGLNDPAHPEWGGWGGRFMHVKGGLYRDDPDTLNGKTEARATVYRWRPDYQNDFQARMGWCVKPAKEANHPPSAGFRGKASRDIVQISAAPGENVPLDANGSADPDGDKLSFRWWVYREAGSFGGDVKMEDATAQKAILKLPKDAQGKSIHVILEVSDDGSPPLKAYRRIVVLGTPASMQ